MNNMKLLIWVPLYLYYTLPLIPGNILHSLILELKKCLLSTLLVMYLYSTSNSWKHFAFSNSRAQKVLVDYIVSKTTKS